MTQYIRTSFSFPAPLYEQLVSMAKKEDTSLVKIVVELLEPAILKAEHEAKEKGYAAIESLIGQGGGSSTDASTTIDQTLYGKQQ